MAAQGELYAQDLHGILERESYVVQAGLGTYMHVLVSGSALLSLRVSFLTLSLIGDEALLHAFKLAFIVVDFPCYDTI